MTTALFIGRFQPFHKGHHNAARTAKAAYDELVIGIGSAATHHASDNPLTFEERKQIVSNCFPGLRIEPFEDKDSNEEWTDTVEKHVDFDVIISGNELVRRLLGDRGYRVEDPDYLKPDTYSGTAIRKRIRNNEDWEHCVPDCSLELLHTFDFKNRLHEIGTQESTEN